MIVPPTVANALDQAVCAGLDRRDATLMMRHLMANQPWTPQERAWLITHDHLRLNAAQMTRWADWVTRRLAGEPVAYLTGVKAFYGLVLQVNPDVLDPRPDTETLVDWALLLLKDRHAPCVLDAGTGSGAIALALAVHAPHAQVSACDASEAALGVARANGERLGLRVRWQMTDWLEQVGGPYDLIVSNPPYIAAHDPHLPALRHEPQQALVAGPDGLRDLRQLITQAPAHLKPGGWLLLEHGFDQSSAVQLLLSEMGFSEVQGRHDLAGIERCSGGIRPEVG